MKLKKAPVVVAVINDEESLRLTTFFDILLTVNLRIKAEKKALKANKYKIKLKHIIVGSCNSGPNFYYQHLPALNLIWH